MSETTLQAIESLKVFWVAIFSLAYGCGGITGKWKRRFLGSALATAGICGFSAWQGAFSWWFLLYFPLLAGALSLGYGATSPGEKIKKRAIYGFACAISSLPIAIITGSWIMFGFHIFLCCLVSVVLGVNNPVSARAEETLIGAMVVFLPLFFFS